MFQNQANSSSFIFHRVALFFNWFWKTLSWFLDHWYYIPFQFGTIHPSFFIFLMLWQKEWIDPQCVHQIKIRLTWNVRHFWINFKIWRWLKSLRDKKCRNTVFEKRSNRLNFHFAKKWFCSFFKYLNYRAKSDQYRNIFKVILSKWKFRCDISRVFYNIVDFFMM